MVLLIDAAGVRQSRAHHQRRRRKLAVVSGELAQHCDVGVGPQMAVKGYRNALCGRDLARDRLQITGPAPPPKRDSIIDRNGYQFIYPGIRFYERITAFPGRKTRLGFDPVAQVEFSRQARGGSWPEFPIAARGRRPSGAQGGAHPPSHSLAATPPGVGFVLWPFVTVALQQHTGSFALAFLCIPAFMAAMTIGVWFWVPEHAGKELNAIIV